MGDTYNLINCQSCPECEKRRPKTGPEQAVAHLEQARQAVEDAAALCVRAADVTQGCRPLSVRNESLSLAEISRGLARLIAAHAWRVDDGERERQQEASQQKA